MLDKKLKRKNSGRIGLLAAAFLLAATILLVQPQPSLAADSNWQAKYWNNVKLSGDPVLVREESKIDYDWGNDSPAAGVDRSNFSVRWKKTVNLAEGSYRFTATMDDGMRIYVDNTLILDAWYDSQVHTVTATTSLSGGDHTIKVEYYDAGGQAVAKMSMEAISTSSGQWRGEYFNNPTLSGSPAFIRNDNQIDFNWGGGSPGSGVAADNFSVRWTRDITLDAGRYRFTTQTDDGVRLWVNNHLLIDKWFDQGSTFYSAEIDLPGGTVPVRMEYYERVGGAEAHLFRTKVSGSGVITEWRGEYFNNRDLSGTPALIRNDANIDFNWGSGSPATGINADNFSVRWTRTINFAPGRYRFTAKADDGVRVWVNDRQIINDWRDSKAEDINAEIDLPAGNAVVRMEYYEHGGGARARLTWVQIGSVPTPPTTGTVTVNVHRLNVRQGPGTGFPIITTLNRGDVLSLAGYRNAAATWIKVVLPGGTQGWLSAAYITTPVTIANLAVDESPTSGTPAPAPTPTPPPATGGGTATINIYRLNVRQGPGTNFRIITTLNRGDVLPLAGYRNAAATWIKVVLPNGTQGWVSAVYVITTVPIVNLTVDNNPTPTPAPVPAPTGATARVTAFYLNVRQGPAATYPVITTVSLNQVYALAGVRNNAGTWVKIVLANGAPGWVNASYVATSVPVSSLPVGN